MVSNHQYIRAFLRSLGFIQKSPYEWVREGHRTHLYVSIQIHMNTSGYVIRVAHSYGKLRNFYYNRRDWGFEQDTKGVDEFMAYMTDLKQESLH